MDKRFEKKNITKRESIDFSSQLKGMSLFKKISETDVVQNTDIEKKQIIGRVKRIKSKKYFRLLNNMNDDSIEIKSDSSSRQLLISNFSILVPLNGIQVYLSEVRKYPLLSRKQEKSLFRSYFETGSTEAAGKLVTSNLRLVVKIAMEYQQRFWMYSLLDLVQEGNIGLLHAVKKFDPFRGIKFSYYASFWIKAYILKFIMDNWRLVRLGTTQAQRKLFYNLRREKERLRTQGIVAGPCFLSNRLGVREQDVVDMEQRLNSWEVSLDAPIRETSDEAYQNFIPDNKLSTEQVLADNELRKIFHDQLILFRKTLNRKEQDILELRLLAEKPITLNNLGKKYGVSRERIRQIQERLLEKLRNFLWETIPNFHREFIELLDSK